MPTDKRQELVDEIAGKIESGIPLTESEVREYLYIARTYSLLYMAREAVSGNPTNKARIREFNCLQNACERHEKMHPELNGPVDESGTVDGISVGYEMSLPVPMKPATGEKIEA